MAKRLGSFHIAALAGILGALVLPWQFAERHHPTDKVMGYIRGLLLSSSGIDIMPERSGGTGKAWTSDFLHLFWAPIGIGVGGSMVASELGLNRAIATKTRGVPLLNRIWV